jgi:hypothetical protein
MALAAHGGLVAGRVVLPIHLKWSGPVEYDLDDEAQRKLVYEVVLREGGEADVRRFIDPDELLRLWSRLVLPSNVRVAWRDYFLLVRGVDPDRGAAVSVRAT